MTKKNKAILLYLIIIIWMAIIFLFSSDNGHSSDSKSKGIIETTVVNVIKITNKIGITDKELDSQEVQVIVDKLNYPLRKLMHMSVYFILAFLVIVCFYIKNKKINKNVWLTLIICFVYACTDELHQRFVGGRTGQFSDVLIDTLGASFGILLWCILMKMKEKKLIRNYNQDN